MKIIVRQFCAFLAAANFDRKQIQELLNAISKTDPKQVLSEVETVRRSFGRDNIERISEPEPTPENEIEKRIYVLLMKEASLSTIEAFALLRQYLAESFPNRQIPPPSKKAGFSAWIRKLAKEFTESELLHVVTRLRNERVHGLTGKDDWLHRDSKSGS